MQQLYHVQWQLLFHWGFCWQEYWIVWLRLVLLQRRFAFQWILVCLAGDRQNCITGLKIGILDFWTFKLIKTLDKLKFFCVCVNIPYFDWSSIRTVVLMFWKVFHAPVAQLVRAWCLYDENHLYSHAKVEGSTPSWSRPFSTLTFLLFKIIFDKFNKFLKWTWKDKCFKITETG